MTPGQAAWIVVKWPAAVRPDYRRHSRGPEPVLTDRRGRHEGVRMDLYPWVVLTHVLAAFGFAMAHGVSAFAAFAMWSSKEPAAVRTLLGVSGMSLGALYISLLLLLVAGIAAAIMGGWFGRGWPWAAIVVVVVIVGAMYAMASRYYANVRSAVGLPSVNDKKGEPPPEPFVPLMANATPSRAAASGGPFPFDRWERSEPREQPPSAHATRAAPGSCPIRAASAPRDPCVTRRHEQSMCRPCKLSKAEALAQHVPHRCPTCHSGSSARLPLVTPSPVIYGAAAPSSSCGLAGVQAARTRTTEGTSGRTSAGRHQRACTAAQSTYCP